MWPSMRNNIIYKRGLLFDSEDSEEEAAINHDVEHVSGTSDTYIWRDIGHEASVKLLGKDPPSTKCDKPDRITDGVLKYLSFAWVLPFVRRGIEAPLQIKDIPQQPQSDKSVALGRKVYERWKKAVVDQGEKNTDWWLLFKVVFGSLISREMHITSVFMLIFAFQASAQAVFVSKVIESVGAKDVAVGIGFACIMLVSQVGCNIHARHMWFHRINSWTRVRAGIQALVYEKSLRIAHVPQGIASNLMSQDPDKVGQFALWIHDLWSIPLQIILGLSTMYFFVGNAVFATIIALIVLTPFNKIGMGILMSMETKMALLQDKRIDKLTEVLQNIVTVKLFGWEKSIAKVRQAEFKSVQKFHYSLAALMLFITLCGTALSAVTLITYALMGSEMNAETIFPVVSLSGSLLWPMFKAPEMMSTFQGAKVSLKRLHRFLILKNLRESPSSRMMTVKSKKKDDNNKKRGAMVIMDEAVCAWPAEPPPLGDAEDDSNDLGLDVRKTESKKERKQRLKQEFEENVKRVAEVNNERKMKPILPMVSLKIKCGELVAVVGSVGAGKSALLRSMLGELNILRGRVEIKHATDTNKCSVCYVPQQAWVRNATLAENILLQKGGDLITTQLNKGGALHDYWKRVSYSCCLDTDIKLLPKGLDSEIGERGTNLSGGQKQRVSLARATMADSDLYLLDDPLSAVDAKVGAEVFSRLLRGPDALLSGRTIVFVTHQTQYLPMCDRVVVLKEGNIEHVDTYTNLIAQGVEFAEMASFELSVSKSQQIDRSHDSEISASTHKPVVTPLISFDDGDVDGDVDVDHVSDDAVESITTQQTTSLKDSLTDEQRRKAEEWAARVASVLREGDAVQNRETGLRYSRDSDSSDTLKTPRRTWAKNSLEITSRGFMQRSHESGQIDANVWVPVKNSEDSLTSLVPKNAAQSQSDESDSESGEKQHEPQEALVQEEDKPEGTVGIEGLLVAQILWLANWSSDVVNASNDVWYFVGLYMALVAGQGIAVFLRQMWLATKFPRASRRLHDRMLHTLLRAPVMFFYRNPVGRIVNRFSKDIQHLDTWMGDQVNDTLAGILQIITSVLFVCVYAPLTFISLPFVAFAMYKLQRMYRPNALELGRLTSVAHSPLFAHYLETLKGAHTVRAFDVTLNMLDEHHAISDRLIKLQFHQAGLGRAFSLYIELCLAMMIFAIALMLVICTQWELTAVSASITGFVLSCMGNLGDSLAFSMRSATDLERNMNKAQRVFEYCKIESEKEVIDNDNNNDNNNNSSATQLDFDAEEQQQSQRKQRLLSMKLPVWMTSTHETNANITIPSNWPQHGKVVFEQTSLRYGPHATRLALKEVSMVIPPRAKVGVVGRTGAGKSTLAAALFRLIPLCGGRVLIDNIDISQVPLHVLRARLGIIPQDPMLFDGTIRSNLDPFGKYSDEDLWTALQRVHQAEAVRSLRLGLSTDVGQGGDSLSVGQRQLLCMARALLSHTQVLCLDEASASVDNQSDQVLQDTIREHLDGITLITIAHRLSTIIDYDLIAVMDKGKVVQFGRPKDLLRLKGGHFAALYAAHQEQHKK